MKLKNNFNFINYFKIKKNSNQNNKLTLKIQKVNTRIKDEKGKKISSVSNQKQINHTWCPSMEKQPR